MVLANIIKIIRISHQTTWTWIFMFLWSDYNRVKIENMKWLVECLENVCLCKYMTSWYESKFDDEWDDFDDKNSLNKIKLDE